MKRLDKYDEVRYRGNWLFHENKQHAIWVSANLRDIKTWKYHRFRKSNPSNHAGRRSYCQRQTTLFEKSEDAEEKFSSLNENIRKNEKEYVWDFAKKQS